MNTSGHFDQRAWDLLNGGLDGELTADEQEEVRELLAGSGGVREVNEELAAFAHLLDGLPELEPPEHLQESIERQIRLPVQDKAPGGKASLLGRWLSANWLRTGLAVAAGVVLTISVYEMGSQPLSERDSNNLAGTVVKDQLPGQGELLDQLQISDETVSGLVEWRKTDDLFTLDVQLHSAGQTELVLDLAGRGFEFEGIEQLNESNDAVTIVNGVVSVTGDGEQHYKLNLQRNEDALDQQTAALGLKLFTNSDLVEDAELRVLLQ